MATAWAIHLLLREVDSAPPLLGLSSTPPHVSKCDNSLICQEQQRVWGWCVFVCVLCVHVWVNKLWRISGTYTWDELLTLADDLACNSSADQYPLCILLVCPALKHFLALPPQLCVFLVQSPLLSSLLRSQWENLNVQKSESFLWQIPSVIQWFYYLQETTEPLFPLYCANKVLESVCCLCAYLCVTLVYKCLVLFLCVKMCTQVCMRICACVQVQNHLWEILDQSIAVLEILRVCVFYTPMPLIVY